MLFGRSLSAIPKVSKIYRQTRFPTGAGAIRLASNRARSFYNTDISGLTDEQEEVRGNPYFVFEINESNAGSSLGMLLMTLRNVKSLLVLQR
jgi:hypothetical protein